MWLKVQIDRTINSSSAGTQRHTPHHMYQLKLICVANGVSHPLRAALELIFGCTIEIGGPMEISIAQFELVLLMVDSI